jgi:hypothetical protein
LKAWYRNKHNCVDGWDSVRLGNPADEPALLQLLKSLKKDDNRNREANQSLPMLYGEMLKLHNFFSDESAVDAEFTNAIKVQLDALFSLSFICMFRIDEAFKSKIGDIKKNEILPREPSITHTKVTVTFRKTNQDNRYEESIFRLYSNSTEVAIDARHKLAVYLNMLRNSNANWHSDALLFPRVNGNKIDFTSRLSQQAVNIYLKNLTTKLGLLGPRTRGAFTTHCFHRGGAQYRFMYASPRWSLEAIKSWGGWSTGEQGGAIYRYLLEEYSRIEYDYSDMLSPFRQDRNISAIDESIAEQPLTRSQFDGSLALVHERLDRIEQMIQDLPSLGTASSSSSCDHDRPADPPSPRQSRSTRTTSRTSMLRRHARARAPREAPPEAPMSIPPAATWLECVGQWNEGDPRIGLKPLKDFTKEERNNKNNLTDKEFNCQKTLHSHRKLVGNEYNLVGHDEFVRTYNDVLNHGLNKLYTAIRNKIKERRQARQG